MRKVFDSGRGLSDAGLAVLADAVRAIENVVSHINESTAFFVRAARAARSACASSRPNSMPSSRRPPTTRAPRRSCRSSPSRPPPPPRGAARPPSTGRRDRVERGAEEFDHEIANIYSEEATELIEAAETSLSAWNHDRKSKDRVAELQRQLHTLKGGARMAGITRHGRPESRARELVIQIDGGTVLGTIARTPSCRRASMSSRECAIW